MSLCHSSEEALCWLCRYTTGAYSMYSGAGADALGAMGTAMYSCEEDGAGAGACEGA